MTLHLGQLPPQGSHRLLNPCPHHPLTALTTFAVTAWRQVYWPLWRFEPSLGRNGVGLGQPCDPSIIQTQDWAKVSSE